MKKFLFLLALLILLSPTAKAASTVLHTPRDNVNQYDAALTTSYPFEGVDDLLVIDIIDIGIGDAILVRAGGETMLIDGGVGSGADTLERFFRSQMVGKIDYFFNTHPHGDHILAQRQLLIRDYLPRVFLSMYPQDYAFQDHQDTVNELLNKGIPYRQITNEEVIKLGRATLTFFHDDRADAGITMNSRSMMLSISFGERSILLAADVTGESLAMLGEKYPELMNADILKSPHHGIDRLRGESFDHIKPEAVVITNTRDGGENLASQLRRRKIPHYFISMGTVRLETDGSFWYLHQMPDVK